MCKGPGLFAKVGGRREATLVIRSKNKKRVKLEVDESLEKSMLAGDPGAHPSASICSWLLRCPGSEDFLANA